MTVFADTYWQAALEAALRATEEAEHVLVPAEFLPHHPRFAPLEYSWGLKGLARLAWCCSKDDVDRLAPWLHARTSSYVWSNEVFVLGGNFRWSRRADAESERHLVAWRERVARYRSGVPSRAANERLAFRREGDTAPAARGRRVLVVGASGMGNVGDDLLAQVVAEMLAETGANVVLSGPDIDPLRVASYDAVVVGGGGLIYASRDGANEAQNLANYLKFGPICRHFRVPVALVGVGDQDHAGGLARDELTATFARNALSQFRYVTTRDADSSALLERLGARNPRTGCDLLFAWAERARAAVRPTAAQPRRIALAGELYRYRAVREGFGDGSGPLAACVKESELDVLVMSNDDVEHAGRMRDALRRAGAAASIVDLRGMDFDALVFLFASCRGLITTRFHGLVFAALADVPVLALDVAEGKKARLLRELGASGSLLLDDEPVEQAVERLANALEGRLEQVPADRVLEHAKLADVHRDVLQAIVSRAWRPFFSSPEIGASVSRAPAVHVAARAAPLVRSARLTEEDLAGLCWAASTVDTSGYANLGDSLSAVMVAGLSGRPIRHVSFDAPVTKLVAVGSIGHAIRRGTAVVWGAGVSIRGGLLARNVPQTRYDVRAIRGPISAQHFRDFGISVPDVFGDPVWLLPSIVDEPVEKKYELGVIPHIQDVAYHHPDAPPRPDSLRYVVDEADAGSVIVFNTWHEPTWEGLLAKIRLLRSCKRIASQSFHGVVIAEAYRIPVLNFRYLIGARNGPVRIRLDEDCSTDPRVWEFYKGGARPYFHMYSQRREERTDWDAVIRAIDELWEPFEYDPTPLVEAFPLPLAFDPLRERLSTHQHLEALRF